MNIATSLFASNKIYLILDVARKDWTNEKISLSKAYLNKDLPILELKKRTWYIKYVIYDK